MLSLKRTLAGLVMSVAAATAIAQTTPDALIKQVSTEVIDTIKGAHLGRGENPESLILDFNFAYNPSCVYDPRWLCPLAGPGNTVDVQIRAGERVDAGAA